MMVMKLWPGRKIKWLEKFQIKVESKYHNIHFYATDDRFKSQTFGLLSPVISKKFDNTFHMNFFVSNALNSLKVI